MRNNLHKCLTCQEIFKRSPKGLIPRYCSMRCFQIRIKKPETIKKQSLAKLGRTPWNKGIKMWEGKQHPRGTLGMIGLGKGNKRSEATKLKLKISHIGLKYPTKCKENHWNWKGGITEPNEKIRKSANYKQWRIRIFVRDNFTCLFCKKIGGILHVDHIIPFSEDENKRFDPENGRTLCLKCHQKTDTYGGKMHSRKRQKS